MFFKEVDLRSRKAMTEFLTGHFRYHTMNNWNNVTSYANNVKLHRLDFPNELYCSAYEMLDMEEFKEEVSDLIYDWESSYDFQWQVGQNGRTGGYLVMCRGSLRPTEHKSFCTQCGQRNFTKVAEFPDGMSEAVVQLHKSIISHLLWIEEVIIENYRQEIAATGLSDNEVKAIIRKYKADEKAGTQYTVTNKCGRCGKDARVNYKTPPKERVTYPGQSIDMHESFEDWSMNELRDRVRLVQSFDRLCDQIVDTLIYFLKNYTVGEETIMVPSTVKVLQPAV